MIWEVRIHPLVFSEDFKEIEKADVQNIIKAIRKKLAVNPLDFGFPLKGNLKGLYKLRVGFYRVIYQVDADRILVLVAKVGKRKDFEVYNEVPKRMKRIAQEIDL